MNFLWDRVFEHFRDRQRGVIFFYCLAAFLPVLILGIIAGQAVGQAVTEEAIAYAAVIFGLLFLVWLVQIFRQARARRRNRYKILPLSRDEICKARSKLMKK